MDTVVHPWSQDAETVLREYAGGMMSVFDDDGRKYWAKLLRVDRHHGIFVEAYRREQGNMTVVVQSSGVILSVQGIMVFDRGGTLEIFGKVTKDIDGDLKHVFTPFDINGSPRVGAVSVTNMFYKKGSKNIPKEIQILFE